MEQRPQKRVEFRSTVESSDPMSEDRGAVWDSETDHLLSYFLGDNQNQSDGVISPPQYTTTTTGVGMSYSSSSAQSTAHRSSGNRRGSSQTTSVSFENEPVPPPTPAIQYYHHHAPSKGSSTKKSQHSQFPLAPVNHPYISDSQQQQNSMPPQFPMPSIAASLVSGGPMVHQQMQQAQHSGSTQTTTMDGTSPISPAALIGPGHEPMILPPPNRQPAQSQTVKSNPYQQQPQPMSKSKAGSPRHIAWLQEINERAKASSGTGNGTMYRSPIPHGAPQSQTTETPSGGTQAPQTGAPASMQPRVGVHPPSMVSGYPPGIPVHHAPVAPGTLAPNHMFYTQAALTHIHHQATQSAGESEEKRAKRLERNRESARKSRRRKKERLSQLEDKVALLHSKIEKERRKQINSMDASLMMFQRERIAQFRNQFIADAAPSASADKAQLRDRIAILVNMTGPNCPVRKAVYEFQYKTLKQTLLPRYQKFLLWLTLHSESYFMAGKEQHARREKQQPLRVTSGKVSSKQIGDELTSGAKAEQDSGEATGGTSSQAEGESAGDRGNQTAQAFDAARMWPLACFELSISVDQEERFVQTHKRLQQLETLGRDRSQIAAAMRMASRLTEAVMYHSHAASLRSEKSFVDILTPEQTIRFQEWFSKNADRCKNTLGRRRVSAGAISASARDNACLMDVCRKLEEVMKISKTNESDDDMTP